MCEKVIFLLGFLPLVHIQYLNYFTPAIVSTYLKILHAVRSYMI